MMHIPQKRLWSRPMDMAASGAKHAEPKHEVAGGDVLLHAVLNIMNQSL